MYTASHGALLSSGPSGDRSANPASVRGRSGFQRALLSVSSAQKCSGAGRLTTPSGDSRAARLAVSCWSPASGHQASHSNGAFPLHGTARYGSVRFTFGGFSTGYCTWYFFSTTSAEVSSDPYRYQNVTCKLY